MKITDIAHVMYAARVLGFTPYQYSECAKIAAAANRHGEALCSVPDYQDKYDRGVARLHARVEKVLAESPARYVYAIGGNGIGGGLSIALAQDAPELPPGRCRGVDICNLPSLLRF